MTVILEDENGEPIKQLSAELNLNILVDFNPNDYTLLKYVDPYGDTTFNHYQISDLISDLVKLKYLKPGSANIIEEIIRLCELSQISTHTYIKFYGN